MENINKKTKNNFKKNIIWCVAIFFILIIGVVAVLFIFGKIPSGKTPTNSNLTNDQVKKDINSYLGADATKTWYYGTDQTKITFTLKATPTQDKSGKWQAALKPNESTKDPEVNLSLTWTTTPSDKDITTQIGNQKYSTTPSKPPTNNLTAKDVANDINNYLKADATKTWYYGTDQTKITFTLKATPTQDKSGKWQAALKPNESTKDPEVNLSLTWTTTPSDKDITTQITTAKYSKTPSKPPTNNLTAKDVANDINNYLKADATKTWYYGTDQTKITFTLKATPTQDKSGKWQAALKPNESTKDPEVNLSLTWTTKANDKDITTQITTTKYSKTPSKPPTNNLTKKQINDDINKYLEGKTWYLNSDTAKKTPITFKLDGAGAGSPRKWKFTLNPTPAKISNKKNPTVDLDLNWTTTPNDKDITTQIGKYYVQKSSNNLNLLLINLNVFNIFK